MYKIPERVAINKFKDQALSQIAFGLNYVLLMFDNDSIQFSGQFLFKLEGQELEREEVYPVNSDFKLLNLLEKKIVDIYCNQERTTLTIYFSKDSFLCLKSNKFCESFELNIEGERVIV